MWNDVVRATRRIASNLLRGKFQLGDQTGTVFRVKVDLGPIGDDGQSLSVVDGVPFPQLFGFFSVPPAGADIVVSAVAGDRANLVAIASNAQAYRPPILQPGDSVLYDIRTGQTIQLTANGVTVTDRFGQTIAMATAGITVTDKFANQVKLSATGIAITEGTGNCVATIDAAGVRITGDNGNLDVAGNLTAGNGVSGAFTTPTGQTVTVQNGIVTNIV